MEICLLQNQHQTEAPCLDGPSPLRDAGPAPWRWAPCSRRRPVRSARPTAPRSAPGANGAARLCHLPRRRVKAIPPPVFPRLRPGRRLAEQLDAMADGGRVSPIMQPRPRRSTQRQAVAAYYASLPAPLDTDKLAATRWAALRGRHTGAWLATRGAWDKNAPPATNAMVPAASASATTSRAGGPVTAYISGQLRAWRQGQRPPARWA